MAITQENIAPGEILDSGSLHPMLETTKLDTVAIVGLGYVGLPTALSFFAAGHRVIGIDVSEARLEAIGGKRVDLIAADRLRLDSALNDDDFVLTGEVGRLGTADAVMICVPTPVDRHLVPDLSLLRRACATVVQSARPGQLIILTSTTYVGSTQAELIAPLAQRSLHAGRDVNVAFSPERIDPGRTDAHNEVPRVVGGASAACLERAAGLLAGITVKVHRVASPEAAELTKLFENTFRAVNIALANELADICRTLGVDVMETIEAAGTKPYGFMPFYPGPGVGGHCIPCDPHYLRWQLRSRRQESPLIDQAMTCILARPRRVVERVIETLARQGRALAAAKVLVYGITYKAGVEDIRESPALEIIEELFAKGIEVSYYDPMAPSVILGDRKLVSLSTPEGAWDLVVAHSVHTVGDAEWLTGCPAVLDASYRLRRTAGVETV
jgi:nucleotide sugar dehydrogenase